MARRRSLTPLITPPLDGATGLRHALLRTIPGRLIVVGVAVRIAMLAAGAVVTPLPAFFNVVDTVAALAIAIGLGYFIYQLFVGAKKRLLWRVRRKLIVSYIFVGFIPAILIVSFFLLGGFLLFSTLSSYLVQSRLHVMSDEARVAAQSIALEIQRAGSSADVAAILARRRPAIARQFPAASMAAIPFNRPCDMSASAAQARAANDAGVASVVTAGPWAHLSPPTAVPSWITCGGFAGLIAYSHPTQDSTEETHVVARGVGFADGSRPPLAIVVDLLVDDLKDRLRAETGVDLEHLSVVTGGSVTPQPGRPDADQIVGRRTSPRARAQVSSVNYLDYRDWATGTAGQLAVSVNLSVGEIYDQISGAKAEAGGRTLGQGLLFALLKVVGGLFLVIEAIALIAGLALAKSITGSVHELFVGTGRVRQGDFTHKIAVKADDQLGELAESFNSMTASIEDLLLQAAEKKRLEEELRIAHEIQMSLLPQGPLLMPGLSVTALCVPAREVGGDYYDFLPLDDHRVGVLIADVSGKGTSAALYMAELKGLILSLSRIHTSPRDLLIDTNRIIAEHLDARSFITMTYGVIDLRARTLTYARAGHTPLIHVPGPGAPSRRARILAPDGLVLGLKIDNGQLFERLLKEEVIPLHPGDLYLFFTDGISEAMNESDDFFGETRLGELAEEHSDLPSAELRERVLREIEAFVGAAPQHDDMTMILLKVDDVATSPTTIKAELAEIAE